ncbi:MAG: hypothetical protein ACFHU9_14610 [Fluviicola sp.]
MKSILFFLIASCLLFGCDGVPDPEEEMSDSEYQKQLQEDQKQEGQDMLDEVPFDINLGELYGDWVLIGVSEDKNAMGLAPQGELFLALREDGRMTFATEGEEEITENLEEIPALFKVMDKNLCSDDALFALQFIQPCVEVIRLNQGRMSVVIEIPEVGVIYKHFVKLGE